MLSVTCPMDAAWLRLTSQNRARTARWYECPRCRRGYQLVLVEVDS